VERIIISLPKELIEALSRLAARKGLARTAYIRMVLTEHVAESGTPPDPPDPAFTAEVGRRGDEYRKGPA
jgi:hypothetical protein